MNNDIGAQQDKYFGKLRYIYRQDVIQIQNVFWKDGVEYFTQSRDINGEVLPIDHYKLFPGELVLDFEHDSKSFPTHKLLNLVKKIYEYAYNTINVDPYPYVTGGTGIHMHMYCDSKLDKELLFRILDNEFDLDTMLVCGLLDNHIIQGSHLIRAPGGRKFSRFGCKYKSFVDTFGVYKSVSSREDINMPNLRGMKAWSYKLDSGLLTTDEMVEII